MQAYAPLAASASGQGADLPDRVLLLYGCTAPGCGRVPGSWRAFVCQLPPSPPPPAEELGPESPPERRETPLSSSDVRRDAESAHIPGTCAAAAAPIATASNAAAFGFGDDDDDSFSLDICAPVPAKQASGKDGGAFDFGDLDAALDMAASAAESASARRRQAVAPGTLEGQEGHGGTAKPGNSSGAAGEGAPASAAVSPPTCVVAGEPLPPILPEFYLYAEEEPAGAVHWGGSGRSGAVGCNGEPLYCQAYIILIHFSVRHAHLITMHFVYATFIAQGMHPRA